MSDTAEKLSDADAATLLGSSKAVAQIIRVYGREDPPWRKLVAYLKNGQLSIDPTGQVRFRKDPFTRERFERAK